MDDLRTFLKKLDENRLLKTISKEVDPESEMGTLFAETDCALLFTKIKGRPAWKVCGELVKNRKLQACLLRTSEENVVPEFVRRYNSALIKPVRVTEAPVKEVVLDKGKIDLSNFPIIKHSDLDGGLYIGSGICITKDPDTDIPNAAIIRLQIKGKSRTGVAFGAPHTRNNYQKYEKMGVAMPMAVAIGVHPLCELGVSYYTSYPKNEFESVGSLIGEPVRMISCETVDLEVPADAEIVLEGNVPPSYREKEGPFGELAGYLGPEGMRPIFEVEAITMRRDPIYRHIQSVFPTDHQALLALCIEAEIYRRVSSIRHIDLKDVHVPPWAGMWTVILKMTPHQEGDAMQAILAAAAISFPHPKIIIVVDEDVEITDPKDLIYSISTRVDPGSDIVLMPRSGRGHWLDPSLPEILTSKDGVGSLGASKIANRIGIDATKPPTSSAHERSKFEKVRPTGWNKVRLKDLIEANKT